MCRFVAYLGERSILLDELLEKPINSLISQSKRARETPSGINADGVGIGWYNLKISPKPGLYKSIQPAWNDENLMSLSANLKSTCFVGHVRASTVGDVIRINCHPFCHENLLFAHNGTIRDFNLLRQQVLAELEPHLFQSIKGQTDSEHFFALLLKYMDKSKHWMAAFPEAFNQAIKRIKALKADIQNDNYIRLNVIMTDGKHLVATRYAYNKDPLSLYYAHGTLIKHTEGTLVNASPLDPEEENPKAVLIASEPLTDCMDEWEEIPENSILLAGGQEGLRIEALQC